MPSIALKSICLVSLNNYFLQLIDLNMIIYCYYILYWKISVVRSELAMHLKASGVSHLVLFYCFLSGNLVISA